MLAIRAFLASNKFASGIDSVSASVPIQRDLQLSLKASGALLKASEKLSRSAVSIAVRQGTAEIARQHRQATTKTARDSSGRFASSKIAPSEVAQTNGKIRNEGISIPPLPSPDLGGVDPAFQAASEVAAPFKAISRPLKAISVKAAGVVQRNGTGLSLSTKTSTDTWLKKLWNESRLGRRDSNLWNERKLREMKDKRGEGDGKGGLLAMLLPLFAGFIAMLTGLFSKFFGMTGLARLLEKILPGALARRLIGGGLGGWRDRGGYGGGDSRNTRRNRRDRNPPTGDDGANPPAPPAGEGGRRGRGGRMRGMRGLGWLAAGAALFGAASVEADDSLTRVEKNQEHGASAGVVANGAAGALAGAAIGQVLIPIPGVGAAIGALVGGYAADYFTGDAAADLGERFATWVSTTPLSAMPGQIVDKFAGWTDELKASAVGQAVIAKVGEWTQELKDSKIGEYITGEWTKLTSSIQSTWDSFSGFLKQKFGIDLGEIGKKVTETAKAGVEAVGNAASSMWNGLTDGARGARDTLAEMTGEKQNTVSGLLHWGESKKRGYNDYNRGSNAPKGSNSEDIDLSNMTLGEIHEKQQLPVGHKDKLFAVGKYQMVGRSANDPIGTFKAGVDALGLDMNTKFTPEIQEKLFVEYLATKKKGRGNLEGFIKGEQGSVEKANSDVAHEWASVGIDGKRGVYDGNGTNKAHISSEEMQASLIKAREKYAELRKTGMDENKAYGIALGAYQEPGAVAAPPIGMIASVASAGMGMYDLAKTGYNKVSGMIGKSSASSEKLTPDQIKELSGIINYTGNTPLAEGIGGLAGQTQQDFYAMAKEYQSKTGNKLNVGSAFRSAKEQERIAVEA